jgi:phosphatidylglycerophosphatase A
MGHISNKALMERVDALPRVESSWRKWVVTGGGVGLLRPAPGSWGTAPPAAIYWGLLCIGMGEPQRSGIFIGIIVVASVLLIAYGKWASAYFREPDPGSVVLDEYAGFALTVLFLPVPAMCGSDPWKLFAFVAAVYILFRATDTLKIPPGNYLERLPWGWGVLCDDLCAGLQANIIAQIVISVWLV